MARNYYLCGVLLGFHFAFRDQNKQLSDVKVWLKKDKWAGDILSTQLDSWQQTNTRYGNDFFYDFCFYADLEGVNKLYSAKALVRLSEVHLSRPGLIIYVKHGAKGKMAVISINYSP
ncbi:hypothetical protein [Paramixta manurensis]|uniref:hypothetical protein n=1 Tax=Paramixta manurensis TaxID=2740817 RepID=UPI00156B8597